MHSRPDYDLDGWRTRIPLLASCIPLNNCSQAPQMDSTRAAAERFLDSWNRTGMDWDAWIEEVRLAKRAFATLINASEEEIAVFSSVSEATSAVASAFDFDNERRTVVVTEAEFPTIGHVWLAQERRGARVRWVPVRDGLIDPARYDTAIDADAAIVSGIISTASSKIFADSRIVRTATARCCTSTPIRHSARYPWTSKRSTWIFLPPAV